MIKEVLKNCDFFMKGYRAIRRFQLNIYGRIIERNGFVAEFKNIKSKFYLPLYKSDLIQIRILLHRNYYERDNLDYICKRWKSGIIDKTIKNGTVLDIGANIGNHTLYYLNECDASKVYAFEPVEETFNMLTKNIEINQLESHVKLMKVGVGSRDGEASVSYSKERNTGETKIAMADGGGIKVVSIDGLNIPEKIGLVKIDTEGFELEVLKGMKETLKRDMPFIMIEIWEDNFEEASDLLVNLGYKYEVLDRQRNVNCDYLFYA